MSNVETARVPGSDRRDLEIDVYRPSGASNGMAVILFHGGGYRAGHRSGMKGYGELLAAAGFVAIGAEYRLLGEAAWPAQLDDARDVVRWAKANAAELGIDPAKIGLQGYSAGGHLSLMVAGTMPGSGHERAVGKDSAGSEVAAVVAFFPPTVIPPEFPIVAGRGEEVARAASPINYSNANFPPTFLLIGDADILLETTDPVLGMYRALADAGAKADLHVLHSQNHEFAALPGMIGGVTDEVVFFYRRSVLERDALAREDKELNIFSKFPTREALFAFMAQAEAHPAR